MNSGEEHHMQKDLIREVAYKQWQILYAMRRKRTLLGILDARSVQLAQTFKRKITEVSNARKYLIETSHGASNPGTWIVRHWRKYLCFKKRILSTWFNDEHQPISFANKIKENHEG